MSVTCDAFNHTLKTFLEELVECAPRCTATAKAVLFLANFDSVVAADPRQPIDAFLETVKPHGDKIVAKDPSVFQQVQLPGGIDIAAIWDGCPEPETREAIWQYLQMLLLLAGTVASMAPDQLEAMENVARGYAAKIESGELDMAGLASQLMAQGMAGSLPGLPKQ